MLCRYIGLWATLKSGINIRFWPYGDIITYWVLEDELAPPLAKIIQDPATGLTEEERQKLLEVLSQTMEDKRQMYYN